MPDHQSSPAALLWARKLQRDNAHLLKKQQQIEASMTERLTIIESKTKMVEEQARTIRSLSDRVKAVEEDDMKRTKEIHAMDVDREERLHLLEAHMPVLKNLDAHMHELDSGEKRMAIEAYSAVVARCTKLEEGQAEILRTLREVMHSPSASLEKCFESIQKNIMAAFGTALKIELRQQLESMDIKKHTVPHHRSRARKPQAEVSDQSLSNLLETSMNAQLLEPFEQSKLCQPKIKSMRPKNLLPAQTLQSNQPIRYLRNRKVPNGAKADAVGWLSIEQQYDADLLEALELSKKPVFAAVSTTGSQKGKDRMMKFPNSANEEGEHTHSLKRSAPEDDKSSSPGGLATENRHTAIKTTKVGKTEYSLQCTTTSRTDATAKPTPGRPSTGDQVTRPAITSYLRPKPAPTNRAGPKVRKRKWRDMPLSPSPSAEKR